MTDYYVDMFSEGNQIKEIHDARIRIVSSLDVGKIVGVNADGELDLIDPPQTVTANPTLEGGEADLNSIKIGDAKYKVAGFSINTSQATQSERRLNFISADHVDYYVEYHVYSGYVLNTSMANRIFYSRSEINGACYVINYGLETLGLEDRVASMGEIINLWEKYQSNQNYAFLLMGLILVAFNEAGVELKDGYGNVVKCYVTIDQTNPTNSNFTQYVLTEDTSNGYELKYVGTHYTIADTATIMNWSFGID